MKVVSAFTVLAIVLFTLAVWVRSQSQKTERLKVDSHSKSLERSGWPKPKPEKQDVQQVNDRHNVSIVQ